MPPELIQPGEVYRYELELAPTSNVFMAGHRIRVDVTSSNFPRFDRNLNTGGKNYDETQGLVAHNSVHHSTQYPSSLKITVARGTTLKVTDNDMMPHKLLQLAGPKAKLIAPAMRHMSAQAKITFAKKGTYKFTTKPGEDYMKGIKTIGPDNVLKLTVTVS